MDYGGRLTDPAWLAFTAVSFLVVIISCSNVANLLLARIAATCTRARDSCVVGSKSRTHCCATSRRERRACILGGTLGLGISLAGIRVVRTIIPKNAMPYWFDYAMDSRVFGALLVVSLGAVLLFGFVTCSSGIAGKRQPGPQGWRSRRQQQPFDRALDDWFSGRSDCPYGDPALICGHRHSHLAAATSLRYALDTPDLVTASITLPPDKYPTPADRVASIVSPGNGLDCFQA